MVAKRELLCLLYRVALSQWEKHKRLGHEADALKLAGHSQPHALTIRQTTALTTAQDSANAFVLILDYTMRRFWKRTKLGDFERYRSAGLTAYKGSGKLNVAVMDFANDVRHLEVTFDGGELKAKTEKTIRGAGEDPAHGSACCTFLENLNRKHGSYAAVEDLVLRSCARSK